MARRTNRTSYQVRCAAPKIVRDNRQDHDPNESSQSRSDNDIRIASIKKSNANESTSSSQEKSSVEGGEKALVNHGDAYHTTSPRGSS